MNIIYILLTIPTYNMKRSINNNNNTSVRAIQALLLALESTMITIEDLLNNHMLQMLQNASDDKQIRDLSYLFSRCSSGITPNDLMRPEIIEAFASASNNKKVMDLASFIARLSFSGISLEYLICPKVLLALKDAAENKQILKLARLNTRMTSPQRVEYDHSTYDQSTELESISNIMSIRDPLSRSLSQKKNVRQRKDNRVHYSRRKTTKEKRLAKIAEQQGISIPHWKEIYYAPEKPLQCSVHL